MGCAGRTKCYADWYRERNKVKQADFHGKQPYLQARELPHQSAYLCTLTMDNPVDSNGVTRYPVGTAPIMDPETGSTLRDDKGRPSYTTSIAYGPSVGKNIMLAYLPHDHCKVGHKLQMEYFGEQYDVTVEAAGYAALYDPESIKPRS